MRAMLFIAGALLAASAARAEDTPICADRPAKGNATCTVPVGQWQLETAAADWLRLEQGGGATETLLLGGSLLKYGIGERSDLEIGFTPYVRVTSGGEHWSGVGDVTLRFKQRLTKADAAASVAIIPFVKLPVAKSGIGNGKVEGGLALPVSFALAGPVSATLGPEVDLLADSDGHGYHAAIVQLVNVAAPVAARLTLVGELWANWNFDPAGTLKQASADAALAYAANNRLQLDAGANLGLTRDTADIELYAGAALRF